MTKKPAEEFEYLSNNPDYIPNPEIEEFMEGEIARAPKDPEQRLCATDPRHAIETSSEFAALGCSARHWT